MQLKSLYFSMTSPLWVRTCGNMKGFYLGGGNWEFQWYVNNSLLYLKLTLIEDAIWIQTLRSGSVNIWDQCQLMIALVMHFMERNAAASGNVINPIWMEWITQKISKCYFLFPLKIPIRSARLSTVNNFSFRVQAPRVSGKQVFVSTVFTGTKRCCTFTSTHPLTKCCRSISRNKPCSNLANLRQVLSILGRVRLIMLPLTKTPIW